MTKFEGTKKQAQNFAASQGYVYYQTSSCGDRPYGSREYWAKPGCEKNRFGAPLDQLCLSQAIGRWVVS